MRISTVTIAIAAGLALAAPAAAQQPAPRLETGSWTGTVTPPGETEVALTFDVSYAGDTLHISMNAGEHGVFEAIGPKLENGKLSFALQVGQQIFCVLDPKDAGYAGFCTDDGGEAAPMAMSPPRKEAQ